MSQHLLESLRDEASQLDRAAFERAHAGLYLFGRFPEEKSKSPEFHTKKLKVKKSELEQSRGEGWFVRKVAKSDRNSWRRRISVGRATNNDIIFRHSTVSKLHAHLQFDDPEAHAGELTLTDAGSQNGTRVNNERMNDEARITLDIGDRVTFGAVECGLLDAKGLHGALRALE